MEHIKRIDELFGINKRKKLLKRGVEIQQEGFNSEVFVEEKPYETSQFQQKKFRVFIRRIEGDIIKTYYIGDIREFKSGGILSYINIDKITEQKPRFNLIPPPSEEMANMISEELNKNYLSRNLMDDTITYKEKLEKDYGIILRV